MGASKDVFQKTPGDRTDSVVGKLKQVFQEHHEQPSTDSLDVSGEVKATSLLQRLYGLCCKVETTTMTTTTPLELMSKIMDIFLAQEETGTDDLEELVDLLGLSLVDPLADCTRYSSEHRATRVV